MCGDVALILHCSMRVTTVSPFLSSHARALCGGEQGEGAGRGREGVKTARIAQSKTLTTRRGEEERKRALPLFAGVHKLHGQQAVDSKKGGGRG